MSTDGNNDSTSESSEVRIREDILNENEEPVSITVQDDHIQKHDEHHKKHKVDIVLKATANAPIMKKRKWTVDGERTIGWIINFIKKYLLMEPGDSLFLYVNQSFAPSPDQVLRNLYECFGTDGKLILHYCKTQAWG